MKLKNSFFIMLFSTTAMAQPVMSGIEISVTEKYKATVAEGIKLTDQPNFIDTAVEKLDVDLQMRSRTWTPEPIMKVIPAMKIGSMQLKRLPANTVHLALGNYTSADAGFAFGNTRSTVLRWGLQGHHVSSQGGYKAISPDGKRWSVYDRTSWVENGLYGSFSHLIGRGRLNTKAGAKWNRYAFYGTPLHSGNGIDSLVGAPGRWIQDYNVEVAYVHSKLRRKQAFKSIGLKSHYWLDQGGRQEELGFKGDIDWRLPVQEVYLELPLSGSLNQLKQQDVFDSVGMPKRFNYWSAQFSPAVSDSVNQIYFRVGLNAIFTGEGGSLDRPYLPPVVHIEFPLVKSVLNIYAGLEGSADNGGMRSRVESMPFLSESADYQAVRQANLYAGATGRLTSTVGYRFGIRQRNYANYAMFTRAYTGMIDGSDSGRFDVQYVGVNMLEPSGELSFQNGLGWEVRAFAMLRTAKRTDGGTLYHVPSSEIGGQAFFNLKDKIRFESTIIYRGSRLAQGENGDETLSAFLDGRLSAVYTYNKQLNATFRIDNLFHSRTTWWTGYPVQGIRANLGLVYKF